jgi:hypothetical protein
MRLAVAMVVVLVGCGVTPSTDASADAPPAPSTITLSSDTIPTAGPGVRLSDGAALGEGEGDLWLTETMVVMIHARTAATICPLGTFASLADVPTSSSACTSAPGPQVTLGGSTQGTDQWVGQSFLVALDGVTTHRMRVQSDSLATTHVRITLDVARIP